MKDWTLRAKLHYLLIIVVMPVYGIQVCPFIEDQNPWEVIVSIDGLLLLAFALRGTLRARLVNSIPLTEQGMRVFFVELSLLLAVGIALTLYNSLVNDFPLSSGFKLLVGFSALGFFAAADLALEHERVVAAHVECENLMLQPVGRYFSVTVKLAWFAGLTVLLVVLVLGLLVVKDLDWLVDANINTTLAEARISVLKEFSFALLIILPETLNIILSYARNLKLFFQREGKVLETVRTGTYQSRVPVSSNDEFGEIAVHTNAMIEKIIERTEELEHKNDELGCALQRVDKEQTEKIAALRKQIEAESANREKSAFLANMSHELRTPLNAIMGYSELLREDAENRSDEMAVNDLGNINTAGKHLLSLINDVLDLSKIEAGKMQLEPETFELRSLIDGVLVLVEPLSKRGENQLILNFESTCTSMHTDPVRLRQVLFNLLSNACKFTNHGIITVVISDCTAKDQAGVEFNVQDTGPGIAPDELEQLFQPFVQASSVGHKQEGTGLGLSLCRRFCEMMGGDISASSVIGEGSKFRFWLPQTN